MSAETPTDPLLVTGEPDAGPGWRRQPLVGVVALTFAVDVVAVPGCPGCNDFARNQLLLATIKPQPKMHAHKIAS